MKINENQKVTLTLGQLKRLVRESKTDEDKNRKEKIEQLKKEREDLVKQWDEEEDQYDRFEDRAGWVSQSRANKIRDGFAKRIYDLRKKIGELDKELKDLRRRSSTK